ALHHRHDAAAAARAVPAFAREAARREVGMRAGELVLAGLEGGADAVAQRLEPARRLGLLPVARQAHDASGRVCGHCRVWRSASPRASAAARATFSERAPAASGIATRASAAAWTSAGTPALSRPTIRTSSLRKAKPGRATSPRVVSRTSRPGPRAAR